jgi:predicted dehydrogenase
MVAMNHRFRQDTMLLKSLIERGELGIPYFVKAGWLKQHIGEHRWFTAMDKAGTGVMLDLGIVLLDLLLWMFQYQPVQSVSAMTHQQQTKHVEDFIHARISFSSGAVATLEAGWSVVRDEFYFCDVYGTKGSAGINPIKVTRRSGNELEAVSHKGEGVSRATLYQKSYQTELQHFINAVAGLVPVLSTGREAFECMRVIEALYRSVEEQREVAIDQD